jgi:3-deoxy-7-phosphoheptulonate synthase
MISNVLAATAPATSPQPRTDDMRVRAIRELVSPEQLMHEYPARLAEAVSVSIARRNIHHILHGRDARLVAVVGPCSIHDPVSAREYATRLVPLRERLGAELEIVMRVYFEKPRTTVGWKGLINDPGLDGSYDINRGLRLARSLLVDINALGVPAGCEFLDPVSPQYISDLVSWAAIGARTTESQVHRELASGVSCPMGFKNGTEGKLKVAIDAILAAQRPHSFLGVTKEGRSAIVQTSGNDDCHVILRGGPVPNYDEPSVQAAIAELVRSGLRPKLMIDCSHDNSRKQHRNQIGVAAEVARQVAHGATGIVGVMIEGHLREGRQDIPPEGGLDGLVYGRSVTDACLGWDDTVDVLEGLASAVRARRKVLAAGTEAGVLTP